MNEQWRDDEGAANISLADLDNAVLELKRLEEDYDACREAAKSANAKCEEQRAKILSMLNSSGKSKYFVEGIGTAYIINRLSFKAPKDPSAKKEFFDYIAGTKGEDVLHNLLTINHQTLNSFCKEEIASATARGEVVFKIPGIDDPTHDQSIGIRKG